MALNLYDEHEADYLRQEDAAERRFNTKLLAHPDPRDPDHPERDESDAAMKKYIVTVELRAPSEVVKREWLATLVDDAKDAFEMTFAHLSAVQQERVIGFNVVTEDA